jgi:hypothetical protein
VATKFSLWFLVRKASGFDGMALKMAYSRIKGVARVYLRQKLWVRTQ